MQRLAISVNEFRRMLLSSCPPTGWGNMIVVAHSGGADSTCLLYLLHQLVTEQRNAREIPRDLLALSVDHSLQPGSANTAERCRQFSESLKVPHVILRIPWGRSPFPKLPVAHRPYESVARAARYRVLMEAMKTSNATVIAMGHHADDNVETLLMRLARDESGDANPIGMRSCRRWGMGTKLDGLDWVGAAGMRRWIVRPLLGVSKERVLATCELHGLNYVDDPTNFQPSLTPRNYVRYCLSKKRCSQRHQESAGHPGDNPPLSKHLDIAIRRLDSIASNLPDLDKDSTSMKRLYTAANYLGQLHESYDRQVEQYFRDFMRASPPSTVYLSPPSHDLLPPPEIRRAIILRVLRFVSPKPWGSPLSEASRRSSSLDLISDKLWSPLLDRRKAFAAGSDVVWRPVSLGHDGHVRLGLGKENSCQLDGWIASRQPPIKRTGHPSPCVRDISDILASNETRELLWDNRFLLKLRPHLLPSHVLSSCCSPGSVMVLPHGRWLLPKIVWQRQGRGVLLGGVGLSDEDQLAHRVFSNWVDIEWIRSIKAI